MSIGLLILGLVLFSGLILVHEFGHFIVAKRNGVGVKEFALFVPPHLYRHKTKAGWIFSINLVPLGGYVSLQGEKDDATKPGDYGAASLWAKTKITGAGVVMNFITAYLLLVLLALIGIPSVVPHQFTIKSDTRTVRNETVITQVESGSPAAKAGIQPEDQLVAIGPTGHLVSASNANTLPNLTKQYAGKTVTVQYKHHGQLHNVMVTLRTKQVVTASQSTKNPKGYLGVYPNSFILQRSTWSAPITAAGLMVQFAGLSGVAFGHAFAGLGSLFAGTVTHNTVAKDHGQVSASSQVTGPIGIYAVLKSGSLLGYQFVLFVVAIVSFSLAVGNLLPIPILDGGRLWITLISRGILKKPLSERAETILAVIGIVIIGTLFITIGIVDYHRFY